MKIRVEATEPLVDYLASRRMELGATWYRKENGDCIVSIDARPVPLEASETFLLEFDPKGLRLKFREGGGGG